MEHSQNNEEHKNPDSLSNSSDKKNSSNDVIEELQQIEDTDYKNKNLNLVESSSDSDSIKNLKNNDDLDFDDCKIQGRQAVPTDKLKNLKLEKASYTFWTEKDKDKLNSFRQFQDETLIQPQKLDDPELIKRISGENNELPAFKKTQSAWNKAKTWEDKSLKVDQVKKYLSEQKIEISQEQNEDCKLVVVDIISVSGEASIAVVRGEPRMGYEINIKMKLEGAKDCVLAGFECTVKIDDLCDDGSEPSKTKFEQQSSEDESIVQQAKSCIGYNNNCGILCKELRKVLKEFPFKFEKN